jgi:hypothetical protein
MSALHLLGGLPSGRRRNKSAQPKRKILALKQQKEFAKEREERELLIILLIGMAIACMLAWPIAQFIARYYDIVERPPLNYQTDGNAMGK